MAEPKIHVERIVAVAAFLLTGTWWFWPEPDPVVPVATNWADLECRPDAFIKQIPKEQYGEWYIELKDDEDNHTITVPVAGAVISFKSCGMAQIGRDMSYDVEVLPRHTNEWKGPFKYFLGMTELPDLGLYRKLKFSAPRLPSGRKLVIIVSIGPYRGG